MKMPMRAPTFVEAMKKLSSDRFDRVVKAVTGPTDGRGMYLHWDEVRRRKAPGDLSHDEWWAGLKLNRRSGRRKIPLTDADGQPFSFQVIESISEGLHRIDLGAGGSIEMPEQVVEPGVRDRYIVNSLIEEAITSSQLEGAGTTRLVADRMLRSGRRPRDRSERMILNNYNTMRRIRNLRDQPLTADLICDLQRRVTLETLDEPGAAGRLRRSDERVEVVDSYGNVFHTPPPAEELPARLDALCTFANGDRIDSFIHPIVRAMIVHFWLAYDHPFVDGNGRCARALFYWSMLRAGYWMAEFISISHVIRRAHARYYRAFLYTETDENDLTYFISYHVNVVLRAIEELHAYIKRKTKEIHAIDAELRGMSGLNHRQKALLRHAVRHPNERYTIQSHQTSHAVVYETARADLMNLVDRDLLQKEKEGRRWIFHPIDRLADRLRGAPE